MLKLRATDARARQEWVNGLRAIAEIHTKVRIIYLLCDMSQRRGLADLHHQLCVRRHAEAEGYRRPSQAGRRGLADLHHQLCVRRHAEAEGYRCSSQAGVGQWAELSLRYTLNDEDSRTFTINCASGDMLKLRATDARARQEWVNGLRAIAEIHTKVRIIYLLCDMSKRRGLADLHHQLCVRRHAEAEGYRRPSQAGATSAASMQCLLQCLGILHRQQQYATVSVASKPSESEQH
ncbi:Oxysterol-binding protein [Operophtera brumata]|uniref:Oxysterol-binding protein n=1 Tax=Operophtera brumata TaxID=104452 RepID=A0A0L7KRU4_OPEBR|nr:Oxysterol-binding protein [Operophtera brumata]